MRSLNNSVTGSLALVGRDEEKKVIFDAFGRTTSKRHIAGSSEIVVVSGKSGVGKSAIVDSLRQSMLDESSNVNGVFGAGKFEQNKQRISRPYSALVDAMETILRVLRRSPKWEGIKKIMKEHEKCTRILCSLFPSLETVLDLTGNVEVQQVKLEHLSELVRKFLRLVTDTLGEPVVLFIDDLQWADSSTLDLLKLLVSDTECKGVLHLWTYRCDEVPDDHPLSLALEEVEKSKEITRLSIEELNLDGVNQILVNTTESRHEETMELAELIHKRTNGNCFFVWNFLQMLQDEGLINFNIMNYKWEWDIDEIVKGTKTSDNVADILIDRIQRLSECSQTILRIAACFGSEFHTDLVFLLMCDVGKESYNKPLDLSEDSPVIDLESELAEFEPQREKFDKTIETLVACGLIEESYVGLMKFSHDRIQQAVYDAEASEAEMETEHLKIGKLLFGLRESPNYNREWLFFGAVDQLNRGSRNMCDVSKVALARSNLKASNLAKAKSAFIPAAAFLKSGIMLINDLDTWGEHYALSLELYSSAAETEQMATNCTGCNFLVNEILSNAKSVKDKFRAYAARTETLISQRKNREAVEMGLDVLQQMGEKFPRKVYPWHILGAISKAKKMLQGKTDEDLLAAPPMDDHMKECVLKMLWRLASAMFFMKEQSLLPLVYVRLLEISVLDGTNKYTCLAYTFYGLMLCRFGDIDDAYRFGSLGMKFMDKADPQSIPTAEVMYHFMISHWKRPIRECLDPMLHAFEVGMEVGEPHFGLLGASGYCVTYIMAGLPLKPVVEDFKKFLQLTRDYKQEGVFMLKAPFLQFVLNLMNDVEDPLSMTGEAMDEREMVAKAEAKQDTAPIRNLRNRQLALAVIFGEFKRAEEFLMATEACVLPAKTALALIEGYFLGGMTYLNLARTATGRKRARYLRKAKPLIKDVEKAVKKGNANCLDWLYLLNAEQLSISKTRTANGVRTAYDKAIQTAQRSGFIHNAALANERAALYFLSNGETSWGEDYMRRAVELYTEWGALGKVHKLEWDHSFLSHSSGGFKENVLSVQGRQRYSVKVANQHGSIRFDDSSSEISMARSQSNLSKSEGIGNASTSSDVSFSESTKLETFFE